MICNADEVFTRDGPSGRLANAFSSSQKAYLLRTPIPLAESVA